jgi:hypothetical protein
VVRLKLMLWERQASAPDGPGGSRPAARAAASAARPRRADAAVAAAAASRRFSGVSSLCSLFTSGLFSSPVLVTL